MSDLISRSKVISVLEQLEEHSLSGKMDISNAIYLLNNQSIAYSVDKVVEELEKIEQHCLDISDWQGQSAICDAIEIVKKGCVSDDVCEWKLEDEESNLYATGCEQRHLVFYETPKENGYRYCPYCGKKIKAVE